MLNRAPDRMLMARMDELMGNVLPAAETPSGEEKVERQRRLIREMSLDSMAVFYRGLFSRPQESVYIICGNFDPDSVARGFSSVFSRLAPSAAPAPSRFSPLSLPTDTLTQRFPNENPSQTAFDYLFFGRYEPGLRNSLVLKIMSNLLRNRVISELREKRALVYSPFVALNYEGLPRGYFYYDINSSAENSAMPEVHQALLSVIETLRSVPVDPAELDAIKRSCIIYIAAEKRRGPGRLRPLRERDRIYHAGRSARRIQPPHQPRPVRNPLYERQRNQTEITPYIILCANLYSPHSSFPPPPRLQRHPPKHTVFSTIPAARFRSPR